jgi:acyl-homoserine lactone acylase PvdQ
LATVAGHETVADRKANMTPRSRWLGLGLAASLAGTGCGKSDPGKAVEPSDGGGGGYQVTIRTTSYGIPHILADDIRGAAAGLGYVGAKDYGCILLDQIVRVRSERAKFFGPGTASANTDSDFGMLALDIHASAARGLAGIDPGTRDGVDGFVAGFNEYLAHEKLSAECDGKAWARPLTAPDLFAYYYWLAQLASGDPLFAAVATAQPPGVAQVSQPLRTPRSGATAGPSARRRPRPARACCSRTRTFPGRATASSTRTRSLFPAS